MTEFDVFRKGICFRKTPELLCTKSYGQLPSKRCEIFWTRDADTEGAINAAMARKYSIVRADFYQQCLPRIFYDHKPTFTTHGDCQQKYYDLERFPEDTADCR